MRGYAADREIESGEGRPSEVQCKVMLNSISDALYVLGGKWKLRIIVALTDGDKRFNELQRLIGGISAKVLSTELKELELNGFVRRNVFDSTPVIQSWCISARLANYILQQKNITIEALQQKINNQLQPIVFELPEVSLSMNVEKAKPLITENVLAFIEGTDPVLKNEVVIISAHYDHLGINPFLTGDQIYNGAADNASGTAATLAIAKAFMQAKQNGQGPRRLQ